MAHFGIFPARTAVVRLPIAAVALGAIAWAAFAFPKFWSEAVFVQIAPHVLAGEAYKPGILDSLVARPEIYVPAVRPSALSKIAVIHLRRAEETIASGAPDIDPRLDVLRQAVDESLASAPGDSFLWLVLFWLDNTRYGFSPEHLADLQMSYSLGPNEAWIAAGRNRLALALFPALPADLAESTIGEFVGLVRSGLYRQAADIVAGPGWPIRNVLLARLKDFKEPDRRYFAKLLEARNIDDASSLLGVAPPADPGR
jgi:hypothetical protein